MYPEFLRIHKKGDDRVYHASRDTKCPNLSIENPELMKTDISRNHESDDGNRVKYPEFLASLKRL